MKSLAFLFLSCLWLVEARSIAVIKAANELRCGTPQNRKMFGTLDATSGVVNGFDADLCKAVAAAIGVTKITWTDATSANRFSLLFDDKIDLLARATTDTIGRRNRYNISFSVPYFYDGQAWAVKTAAGITGSSGIKKFCVVASSSSYENAQSLFPTKTTVTYKDASEAVNGLAKGECEAATTDGAILADFIDSTMQVLSNEVFSFEPLALGTRQLDSDLSRLTTNLILALLANDASLFDSAYDANSGVSMQAAIDEVGSYSDIYNRWVEAKLPRAGSLNEVAAANNIGLHVIPEKGRTTTNGAINLSGQKVEDILKAEKIKCQVIDNVAPKFCQSLALILFNDATKAEISTTSGDLAIGVQFSYTDSTQLYSQPLGYISSTDGGYIDSWYVTATDASNLGLARLVDSVRNALVLAEQYPLNLGHEAPGEEGRLYGSDANSTQNYGLGGFVPWNFVEKMVKQYGTMQDQTGMSTGPNLPYKQNFGKMWSSVWNGERVPRLDRSAGYWIEIDLDGSTIEAPCTEYFLDRESDATNVLFYLNGDDEECFSIMDMINMRGTDTCNEDGVQTTYSFIMKVNSDESETYATFNDPVDSSGTINYPSDFIASDTVSLARFKRCPPPPVDYGTQAPSGASTVTMNMTGLLMVLLGLLL